MFPSTSTSNYQANFQVHDPLHQGTDPNSPELFKQSIQIIQQHVARLQSLARSTLLDIQNAYHPGNSPAQAEANLASLKQTLQLIADMMRVSGVGALPLLPLPTSPDAQYPMPTEDQMLEETTQAVKVTYDKLKKAQESAADVANLLAAPSTRQTK